MTFPQLKELLNDQIIQEFLMEAPPGFEPGVKVLQTSALPLGYGAMVASLGIEPRTRRFSVYCSTD